MHKMAMFVVLGFAALTTACGSSSSSGTDGGGGVAGSGGAGGGGGGSSGSCNYPSCLKSAMSGCEPSGTCVQQSSGLLGANICYANGVKEIFGVDLTGAITASVKNASKTCVTMSGTLSQDGSSTLTIKDGSGATLGTITGDASGKTAVTCTGGQPVTLASGCELASGASGGPDCTDGACSP